MPKQYISNLIGLVNQKRMTIEEAEETLSIQSHYEMFLLLFIRNKLNDIREILNDEYPKEEIEMWQEEITTNLKTAYETYKNKYLKLFDLQEGVKPVESIDTTLPIIFTKDGETFLKSYEEFLGDKSTAVKVITSLGEGHTMNDSKLVGNNSGFFLKGKDEIIIYKRFKSRVNGEHIIIDRIVGRNELKKINEKEINADNEEKIISENDAEYRKLLKKSKEIYESLVRTMKY